RSSATSSPRCSRSSTTASPRASCVRWTQPSRRRACSTCWIPGRDAIRFPAGALHSSSRRTSSAWSWTGSGSERLVLTYREGKTLGARGRCLRAAGPIRDPLDGELEVLERVRVREAQVALANRAERGACKAGDAGLLQNAARDRRRVPRAEAGDVREDVERSGWRATGDAFDLVEACDDRIAPLAERLHHFRDLWRPLAHRDDARALRERRG